MNFRLEFLKFHRNEICSNIDWFFGLIEFCFKREEEVKFSSLVCFGTQKRALT